MTREAQCGWCSCWRRLAFAFGNDLMKGTLLKGPLTPEDTQGVAGGRFLHFSVANSVFGVFFFFFFHRQNMVFVV